MHLPAPRGPLSERLVDRLSGRTASCAGPWAAVADPLVDDDLQLALWICYELAYRGFADVPDELECDSDVLAHRSALEAALLDGLRAQVAVPPSDAPVPERLTALVNADDGPSLSRYLERSGTRTEFTEFVVHRSLYQLKEGDPHSWAIPRLRGAAKAALVTIQADEYGGGILARMHSELFRATMRGLGLDDTDSHYVDAVPGVTLAISNVPSLFGLRRALRGASVGHLAAFEMTSSAPNRSYSRALRRLGGDERTRRFFDVHVTADALHEQLAAVDLCGGLVAAEPHLADDVVFGAACALELDRRFATHLLAQWREGRSSLLSRDQPVSNVS
jgi:Iron-containing redox enzyme